MSELKKVINIFLYSLLIFFASPYIIKNNKIQTNAIQKWASILILNFISTYFLYKFGFETAPENVSEDPYLFLGYLRAVTLGISTLLSSLIISKSHEKIVNVTNIIFEIYETLNARQGKRLKFILIIEIFIIYFSVLLILYTSMLRQNPSIIIKILMAYNSIIFYLSCMVAEFYFINLILMLYVCAEGVHKKLEEIKAPIPNILKSNL